MWKSFKNRQNDKKLLPRLYYVSYALMGLGLIFYLYILICEIVPSGVSFLAPDWGIFNGASFSENLDTFTLSDKEANQLYIVAPFFIALGSLLKLFGVKRNER